MISIIGGGPVGCYIAYHSVQKGYDTILYDYQKRENRKVQCSGLVSSLGIDRLGLTSTVQASKSVIQNKVRGAKLFSPSGKEIVIDAKKTKAYVFDRVIFDNLLLDMAIDSGVNFINEKIKDLHDLHSLQKTSDKIIIATGTNYSLHKKLNLKKPDKFFIGAQYVIDIESDPDFVELYFDIVPEFFSWLIPLNESRARVGLCSWKDPLSYLERFIKKLKKEGRIKKEKIIEKNFGIIPVYKPDIKTSYACGKIITVGDAAGQVKATTGGGIVMGCLSGINAMEDDYERLWKRKIGKELYLHLKTRNFLNKLSDKNKERLFSLISENKSVIEEKGDMDVISKLVYSLGKNPKFMIKLISLAPYFIPDLLF